MAGTAVTSKTVIIADDTASVRDRFRAALENAGHEVVAIENGAELSTRIRGGMAGIDLIVLDLRLTETSGVDLVRSVRNIGRGRVPVVIFSGTIASAGEVRELAVLGVAGYVNEYSAAPHILPALAPHLFPANFNRRGSPRVTLAVPIEYRSAGTIATALTLHLSHGGIGIRTTNPLDAGSRITLRFRMPGSKQDIDAEGRVSWSDPRVGMGIQFEAADPASQAAINGFVDGHAFSNRKA